MFLIDNNLFILEFFEFVSFLVFEGFQETPQEIVGLEGKVLDVLRVNARFTRDEIALELGIGSETVKEYLSKLKKKGLLLREGSTKSGSWKVARGAEK